MRTNTPRSNEADEIKERSVLHEARNAAYVSLVRSCLGCNGNDHAIGLAGNPPHYVGAREANREEGAPCRECKIPVIGNEFLQSQTRGSGEDQLEAAQAVPELIESARQGLGLEIL